MARIEVQNARFCYGERGRCLRALDDLSFTVESGEFVCLLGRSGCGKTTLLRLIAGLSAPTQGAVLLDGRPVTLPGPDRAVVFQNDPLFPWLTVRKNVIFALRQARKEVGRAQAEEIADYWLHRVDLQDAAGLYPCELSGGMKQRAAIARALAMDADVLLLDEPFAALDTRIRRELQALLEDLWQGEGKQRKTVLFVTHDIGEAALLAGRVLFMTPGHLAADLTVDLPRPREGAALEEWKARLTELYYEHGGREDTDES